MSESNYTKKALPEYQKEHPETILMRNNTGMLYTGKITWKVIDGKKILIIENPVPVFFGVGLSVKDKKTKRPVQKGGGDWLGWTEKTICDIIPKILISSIKNCCDHKCKECKVAIFTSIETKSKDGKESPDQIRFRETVQKAGGIAIVLREE
jgi:hypothetical protein